MKVTVLGGGSMGTACGILLAESPEVSVTIWARTADRATQMQQTRENPDRLPGARLNERISVTADISAAVDGASLIVAAIPTAFLRLVLQQAAAAVPKVCPVVSVIKGVENGTFLRPSEIICDVLGPRGVVALCGPSHAEELMQRLPASIVAASSDLKLAQEVQRLFSTDRFRVYTNPDIVGVELAAALKNVVAIAAGICDGLGFGDNAKAALVTRGIVEISRFGVAHGALPETFSGLAGLGDLIVTCFSRHSRNRRLGERLGSGLSLEAAKVELGGVAEGVYTSASIARMAEKSGVEMPIATEVHRVLFEGRPPLAATQSLFSRPLRTEG